MKVLRTGGFWTGVAISLIACDVRAQCPASPVIDQIRVLPSMADGDPSRIERWITGQIEDLTLAQAQDPVGARKQFRLCVIGQYEHARNTPQFISVLAAQLTKAADTRFANGGLNPTVSHALARVLVDLKRPDTHSALLAGLKSADASTRLLCARGLATQRDSIAKDDAELSLTVKALLEAGSSETDSTVLASLYRALAYPNNVPAVFDAYLALFDARLDRRKGTAVYADRAEVDAFDYLRSRGVINGLTADQKSALALRLAVFLRLDAERYVSDDLSFSEQEILERRLDGNEACLAALVGARTGGSIRRELRDGGYQRREAALQEAYKWIGHPTTQQAGALNSAPWDVPVGAP